MQVVFYINRNDNRKLNKDLQEVLNLNNVQFTNEESITNLNLSMNFNESLLNCNYCYIPKLKRYYFIDDMQITNNNLIYVSTSVDVLMSNKSDIENLQIIAERSTNKFNAYLQDNEFIVQSDNQVQIKALPNKPFYPHSLNNSSRSYVLMVARGGVE